MASQGKDKPPMKGFKSASSRLGKLFLKSPDQWKERAALKPKKLRAMEVKVSDLSASRGHWKDRAMQAEKQQHSLEKELETLKKTSQKS